MNLWSLSLLAFTLHSYPPKRVLLTGSLDSICFPNEIHGQQAGPLGPGSCLLFCLSPHPIRAAAWPDHIQGLVLPHSSMSLLHCSWFWKCSAPKPHPFLRIWKTPSLVAKSSPTLMIPWTVACQALLSMGFSRQEYWSRLPFYSLGKHLPIYKHLS